MASNQTNEATATSQSTSGPWEAKHLDATHFVINSRDHGAVAKTVVPIGADAMTIRANAELIAAAPELAEALADLTALVKDGYQYNDIAVTRSLTQARAALVKAGAK